MIGVTGDDQPPVMVCCETGQLCCEPSVIGPIVHCGAAPPPPAIGVKVPGVTGVNVCGVTCGVTGVNVCGVTGVSVCGVKGVNESSYASGYSGSWIGTSNFGGTFSSSTSGTGTQYVFSANVSYSVAQ